ncbi:hypothetical protein N7474_000647 [Penicillium riverlandense]|uniref:uncharacterized protein n=1 Tax=Penicillium riverlandense TaxID=1903569 RepID=UPI002546756B|nr:uncharacterized protein N7474_000647 [Penicillium riverlandense]KAJ5832336.1 hypothetical protein N7474_000647 [Penicillium riverlandense]
MCSQWPPAPCVEDEPDSLARELNGLAHIGDEPGLEGTCIRGSVDQNPVIMTPNIPSSSSFSSFSSVPDVPGMGSNISSDDSSGPITPPATHDPVFCATAGSHLDDGLQRAPSSSSSRTRGRASEPEVYQKPSCEPTTSRPSCPPSLSRGNKYNGVPVESTSHGSPRMEGPGHSRPGGPAYSNYPMKPVNVSTLAGRIEEKLKLKRDQRESVLVSNTESRTRTARVEPLNIGVGSHVPTSASHSPPREPHRAPSVRSYHEQPPPARSRTTSVPPAFQAKSRPEIPPSTRSASSTRNRPRSGSDESHAAPGKATSRPPSQDRFQSQPMQRNVSNRTSPNRDPAATQQSSNAAGLCLAPCPRAIPTSAYYDWYTLKGLTHLDICPSCMSQIAHSRFREYFIPSQPKPVSQKTRCAFSNPWTRLAWTRMITKYHDSLEMLYQMTRPPPGARPCPGRSATDQTWHRIIDPGTGSYLPRFHICGSCARNVRILMPAHRDTFIPSTEPQERTCDLVTSSPRFIHFIDLLDAAATRAEASHLPRPDTRELLAYARRKVALRDCRRDRPVLSTWHYIAALPELSVCEDCYDEAVWPLVRARHPIARLFCPSLRLLPGDGPGHCREASCQMYSPRMRAWFRDAVVRDDFATLRSVALRRFDAERRFHHRRDELLEAEARGYHVSDEMRKAVEEWRRWE